MEAITFVASVKYEACIAISIKKQKQKNFLNETSIEHLTSRLSYEATFTDNLEA